MQDVDPEQHRDQLARYARSKKRRALGWPRDWSPGIVINPESGLPFTDVGAWELIAYLLESGHPIETIVLNNPRGKIGFVLHYKIESNPVPLYIKIQLGGSGVIGRSFHISHVA